MAARDKRRKHKGSRLAPIELAAEPSRRNPIFFYVTACIAVVSVFLGATALVLQSVESKAAARVKPPRDARVRRAIDGALTLPASSTPRIAAVVMDNLKDAYPLRGLEAASLVYEAPVEGGGATRLLAFFTEDADASEIGPVRSLRPYFTDWSLELGAMPVHVGGSPEALEEIVSEQIPTLNQFFQSEYFWRSGDRARPHNVFTSGDLLAEALRARWHGSKKIAPWSYRDGKKIASGSKARRLEVGDRDSAWEWQGGWYVWGRSAGWERPVRAANVVVMETAIKITDAVGRRSIATSGEGRATVFSGGKKIVGTWIKKNPAERAQLVSDGRPIQLGPGMTWVHAVPKGTKLVIRN